MDVPRIWFDQDHIYLKTTEGIEKSMPLEWFPKLAQATPKQREKYELSPFGVHWEILDEDLSFEGFFSFQKENIGI